MILSVVIPTRDKRPLLERTLSALGGQELVGRAWEVVVVNDGSGDDTAEYLARAAVAGDLDLVVVSPPQNVGRAAARNLGWRRARGRWVLFLDDDILAPPGLLAAHLAILEVNPRFGTIGPTVTAAEIADAPHFRYIDTRGVAKLKPGVAPARYFVTQNAAVPRDALIAIDGFDEGYSAYGFEDMDLGFRLEDAGLQFRVLAKPVPQHIHHHTLDEYLRKKWVCGRHSLREIAWRHPRRLHEMRLDLVIDPGDLRRASVPARLLRGCLGGRFGDAVLAIVQHWPALRRVRPLCPALYARFMDCAVLASYLRGFRNSSET